MNADQIAFQEKFKDQMQTLGKNGILGTLNSNRNYNNNGANLPVKIIHHTAYEINPPHRKNLLKPIKPQTPSIVNANDTTSKTDTTIQQDCTNMTNEPYINQHPVPNGNMPQYSPYMSPPPLQMNPYVPYNYPPQMMMMNPYYNNPYMGYNNMMNNVQHQQSNNVQLPTPPSRTRLRPISSQSRMNTTNTNTTNTNTTNLSNLSSGRVCSAYSRSRFVEYKPYTLKDYKEMEKVGVVLGGLGPNIGTKEWEEKREKMKKMEEYAKRVGGLKNKVKKRKERVEDIIEKEKKKKIENSIRRRCYEYANLVRPKTRIEQRVNRTNLLNNNNTNNTTKCTIDCEAPSTNTTVQPEIKILSKNKSLGRITRPSPYITNDTSNSRRQKSSMAIERYHIEEDNSPNIDDIINNNITNTENELNIEQNSELSKLLQVRENYKKVIDQIKNTL